MRILIECLIIIALIVAYVFFLFAAPDVPWSGVLLLGALVGTVIIALILAMIHGIDSPYTRRRRSLERSRFASPDLRDGGTKHFLRLVDRK
jgi:uncharacterized membrane protein